MTTYHDGNEAERFIDINVSGGFPCPGNKISEQIDKSLSIASAAGCAIRTAFAVIETSAGDAVQRFSQRRQG